MCPVDETTGKVHGASGAHTQAQRHLSQEDCLSTGIREDGLRVLVQPLGESKYPSADSEAMAGPVAPQGHPPSRSSVSVARSEHAINLNPPPRMGHRALQSRHRKFKIEGGRMELA